MRSRLIVFFLFASFVCSAQNDTLVAYYDLSWKETASGQASYYSVAIKQIQFGADIIFT